MNYTDFISSSKGDIYQVSLSSKNGGLIADDVRQSLSTEGIIVVDVELNRVQGLNPTTNAVLAKIGEKIADVFMANPNVIICYFCDFLSELPYTNKKHKKMSVQEYRSILFSQMFDRYVSQHHLFGEGWSMCQRKHSASLPVIIGISLIGLAIIKLFLFSAKKLQRIGEITKRFWKINAV